MDMRGSLIRLCAFVTCFVWSVVSTNAAAVVVIDFGTGLAGAGGTINYDGANAVGTNIRIGAMIVEGTTSADGTYTVTNGLLNFDTAADTITLTGSISDGGIVVSATTLLSGSFNSYSVQSFPGPTEVFPADGPDTKSPDLLTALGVDISTPFKYFGFSIESANGNVVSTDIVNTAVPVPAAVWLFGTGLVGLVAVARRRSS